MRNSPFTFALWLPFLFHHAHWDQTEESLGLSLGSRPTLAQGPSAHVPLLFVTAFHCLCVQPPRLPPSEGVSKHTFLTWPSPRRHRCALLPVDVTERLQRLRIWTAIWLLCHWAWLRQGYWHYRNLIDWLIDKRHNWRFCLATGYTYIQWLRKSVIATEKGEHSCFA